MTITLTDRFRQALDYAFELHRHQDRKGSGVPYMSHLLAVAGLVMEDNGDEDETIAALLHDAVEDQGGMETLEAIRTRFGERVAGIVMGCSDCHGTPKPPWEERKKAYLAHLRVAEPSVMKVSLADKIHNARDILMGYHRFGSQIWGRFRGGRDGSLWYYRELVGIFRERRSDALVDELERVVLELESLADGEVPLAL
jgi:(p)ppGpp synthase/HD superfamily hydrolase